MIGCSRAAHAGYDHCARCGTSYWHVAGAHGVPSPFQDGLDPIADLCRLVHLPLPTLRHPLAVIGELEGSELFIEEPACT